jgi:hypothetical protein
MIDLHISYKAHTLLVSPGSCTLIKPNMPHFVIDSAGHWPTQHHLEVWNIFCTELNREDRFERPSTSDFGTHSHTSGVAFCIQGKPVETALFPDTFLKDLIRCTVVFPVLFPKGSMLKADGFKRLLRVVKPNTMFHTHGMLLMFKNVLGFNLTSFGATVLDITSQIMELAKVKDLGIVNYNDSWNSHKHYTGVTALHDERIRGMRTVHKAKHVDINQPVCKENNYNPFCHLALLGELCCLQKYKELGGKINTKSRVKSIVQKHLGFRKRYAEGDHIPERIEKIMNTIKIAPLSDEDRTECERTTIVENLGEYETKTR